MFQHTAARRRLAALKRNYPDMTRVSTHSRPKAAGISYEFTWVPPLVSTHSRPKAAGIRSAWMTCRRFCFNTQPPEGGWYFFPLKSIKQNSFNTQPPEGGWHTSFANALSNVMFQHTAARRRLGLQSKNIDFIVEVSTHSRPKAAGKLVLETVHIRKRFQHTAARRRLEPLLKALLHQVSQP